jgi:PqqA peptide cyclase
MLGRVGGKGTDPSDRAMTAELSRALGILLELTHRCPLHCPYCSNPLNLTARESELPVSVWKRVIREAAEMGVLQAGFSGGEPLLYSRIAELITVARENGIYSNLITSGLGLDLRKAEELKVAGLDTVQISFQADEAELADAIAGTRAHAKKLQAVEAAGRVGLPWTANIVLHRSNIDRIDKFIKLAEHLGAFRVELANTQFYGWAFENKQYLLPTRDQLQRAQQIVDRERTRLNGQLQLVYVACDYYERRPKPCLHGWGSRSLTVNPCGDVLPCQAASGIPDLTFDNVTNRSLSWIWNNSSAFQRFRGTEWLTEPCQSCSLREVDRGGCRCQVALFGGKLDGPDPVCELSRDRVLVDEWLRAVELSPEANRPRSEAFMRDVIPRNFPSHSVVKGEKAPSAAH